MKDKKVFICSVPSNSWDNADGQKPRNKQPEPPKQSQTMMYHNGTQYPVIIKDEHGNFHTVQSGHSVVLPTGKNRIKYLFAKGWQKL